MAASVLFMFLAHSCGQISAELMGRLRDSSMSG